MSVTENILQANPDIKAIFSVNDMMALGALQAVQAAQKDKDIIIVGFDATEEAVKYIKEDSALKASVAQKPIELGKATMEAMLKACLLYTSLRRKLLRAHRLAGLDPFVRRSMWD